MLDRDGLVHIVPMKGDIRVWEPPHVEFFGAKRQPDDTHATCFVCITAYGGR